MEYGHPAGAQAQIRAEALMEISIACQLVRRVWRATSPCHGGNQVCPGDRAWL